jgi:very-short-patch-repair endonuclease
MPIAESQSRLQPRKPRRTTSYKLTEAQTLLGIHVRELGLAVEYEHEFCERGWRFDLYLPEPRIGIEVNGGHFLSRGHRSYRDLDEEYAKLNTATMMGIRILQFSNEFVRDGRAKEFIAEYL